jgi:hypothetical protein
VAAQDQGERQGRLPHQLDQHLAHARGTPTILYHGGPVMVAATNLYIVYYGTFTSTQHSILDTFLQNLGGSPAFNVNTEYFNAQNPFIQNVVNYNPAADSYNDAYSLGTNLSGSFVTTILRNAVAGGHLPTDSNGIYLLTISPDVKLPKNVVCLSLAYVECDRERRGYQVCAGSGSAGVDSEFVLGEPGDLWRYHQSQWGRGDG